MIRVIGTTIAIFLNLLPQSLLLAFGDLIGWVWFHLLRFRRQVVFENLRLALGHEKSEKELHRIAASCFRHYGRTFIEVIQSLSWDKAAFQRHVQIDGRENLDAVLAKGKGAFVLTSHLGNWELGVQVAGIQGIPLDIVVKRTRSRSMQSFLEWYRKRSSMGVFWEEGTAREMLRSVSQGRGMVCVLDQFMGPPIGLPVTFFGKQAGTAVGLALLSEKREAPVVLAYNYRDDAGKLHLVFLKALEFKGLSPDRNERLYQKTQAFNDAIEECVRKFPEQWLWIHRRWKDYRGEPRWRLGAALVPSLLLLATVIVGCAATKPATTGIEVPPEPTIQVPVVTEVQKPVGQAGKQFEIKVAKAPKEKKKTPIPVKVDLVNVDRIPFEVGERMALDLGWAALPAGRAVLEVRRGDIVSGRPTFWLWANVTSSRLVDAIYHVENTVESFVDAVGLFPYKFLLHMLETDQVKETRVVFDHTKAKAFYWAKRISKRWGDMTATREDATHPLVQDMFSAIYYSRTIDYRLGKKETFLVYENGQNFNVEVTPVANELVNTKLGIFQCWKVLVLVKVDNVLKQTGDIFMWQSDDSKRFLVKFDAKIKIGSLYGNLVELRERL